jgi:hypothetical protein
MDPFVLNPVTAAKKNRPSRLSPGGLQILFLFLPLER